MGVTRTSDDSRQARKLATDSNGNTYRTEPEKKPKVRSLPHAAAGVQKIGERPALQEDGLAKTGPSPRSLTTAPVAPTALETGIAPKFSAATKDTATPPSDGPAAAAVDQAPAPAPRTPTGMSPAREAATATATAESLLSSYSRQTETFLNAVHNDSYSDWVELAQKAVGVEHNRLRPEDASEAMLRLNAAVWTASCGGC